MTALECFYKDDSMLILFKGVLGTQSDEILPSMFLPMKKRERSEFRPGQD